MTTDWRDERIAGLEAEGARKDARIAEIKSSRSHVMTVAHTARKKNKSVLAFLTACCRARFGRAPRPSLFVPDVVAA